MKYIIPVIGAIIAAVVLALLCNAFIEWRWSWIGQWTLGARGLLLVVAITFGAYAAIYVEGSKP